MYGWIWRHIPFRQPALKALVSVLLGVAVVALLWLKVFPAVEPLLPFYDGQIQNSNGTPANGGDVLAPSPSITPSR